METATSSAQQFTEWIRIRRILFPSVKRDCKSVKHSQFTLIDFLKLAIINFWSTLRLYLLFYFNFQARSITSCRSTTDLTQHLFLQFSAEVSSSGDSRSGLLKLLREQIKALQEEFTQLELIAITKETEMRDEK